MRTPETLTAAQRAEMLRAEAPAASPNEAKTTPQDMTKRNSLDLARSSLMSGMSLDSPGASAGLDPRKDVDGAFSILRVDDIVFYRHNPRQRRNPKYAEIKESIRAQGITNTLTVTRRPGEEKYFPFGGGNTRLEIAKELLQEGETRFATLQVLIKLWSSESDVIAAHLAENNNRGDTSFWENAQGVLSFKREWEAEHEGSTIVGADLNQELRVSGINYGVKMIQNFLFAAEFMEPVGPWLRTVDVNVRLRPKLGGLIELATKLNQQRPVTAALRQTLEAQAADLEVLERRNRDLDPAERVAVELDAGQVVEEATEAIGAALEMPFARLQFLSDALQAKPRLSAKDLLALETRPAVPQPVTRTAPPLAAQQGPTTHAPASQMPLGAMAGVVGGTQSHAPHEHAGGPAEHTLATTEAVPDSAALHRQMLGLLTQLDQMVPIGDCVLAAPGMPFGFFMELPQQPVQFVDDAELESGLVELRQALWWLLVVLSGQTQGPVFLSVRDDPVVAESAWTAMLVRGPRAMCAELDRLMGQVFAATGGFRSAEGGIVFEVFPAGLGIWTLLMHPQAGPLVAHLLTLLTRRRAESPVDDPRFYGGHVVLPEWDDSML